MKILQGISGLSLVALLMVGCSGKNDLDKAPPPKPSVNKVSVAPSPSKPSPAATVTKGLTPSTEPIKISIPKGRVDPFAAIAVTPIKQTQPQAQTPKTQTPAQLVKTQQPKTQAQPAKTQQPKTQPQIQPAKTQALAQTPKIQDKKIVREVIKPASSTIKPIPTQNLNLPPAPPSIEIAQAIQVKGVVELGGKVSAIVKESQESDSRSVNAGDYVAQGKVLVKRIEFNGNREPVVILEQNGVEVIKQV